MKKIVLTAVASLMLVFSAKAQVFMMDADGDNGRAGAGDEISVIVPIHGVEYDQTNYTPLGGGTLLLAGLGAAYLTKKKHKQDQ